MTPLFFFFFFFFFFEANLGHCWQLLNSPEGYFVNIIKDLIKLPRNYWKNACRKPFWKNFTRYDSSCRFQWGITIYFRIWKRGTPSPINRRSQIQSPSTSASNTKNSRYPWYEIFDVIMSVFIPFHCFLI